MPLKLFDTKERTIKPFVPQDPKSVKMYTCGPTVYDYAHIGNFRTFVAEDLLRRTLKHLGYGVFQVMNLTDVDDKTIKGALQENTTLAAFTQRYTDAFFDDLKTLSIDPAEAYPKATDYIPQMVEMIRTLLEKKLAYVSNDGSVYFKLDTFPCYGCLSHLNLEELQLNASERTRMDDYGKEHISDFVLWKRHERDRDGDISWPSPWGEGRPGWHIECSVMAKGLLGNTIDIHAGGVDLIFPHHENEIAQSESANGVLFSKYWFHVEHLLVDHKKMSKSLGNFYTLRTLIEKGFSGKAIRYLLLSVHYRSQLNFTKGSLEASNQALARINDFHQRLLRSQNEATGSESSGDICSKAKIHFDEALQEDLNISEALAALFELIREGNSLLDKKTISPQGVKEILDTLLTFDTVLALLPTAQNSVPEEVLKLHQARQDARGKKDFAQSDALRQKISELGFIVEDGPKGSYVKPKSTH